MERIKEHLSVLNEVSSIADYWSAFNKISPILGELDAPDKKRIKIALLSSFTIDPLEPYLTITCLEQGIVPDIYVAGFNQYAQEVMNGSSGLHNHRPDITFISINLSAVITPEQYEGIYSMSETDRKALIDQAVSHCTSIIEKAKSTSELVVLHNFMIPTHAPHGIYDTKHEYGHKDMVRTINRKLNTALLDDNTACILDYENLCATYGKSRIRNEKIYYLSKIEMDGPFLKELADEYMRYIIPYKGLTKKCIVLDLDNTLWGGVVGEEGVDGIKIGHEFPGNCFREFQYRLKLLKEKGIILAINSKNNPDDALEVFRKRKEMILKEDDFIIKKLNWTDKATNIKEIAEEINIGMDSLVFIDDSKAECLLIQETYPEVTTINLPTDPSKYPRLLDRLPYFEMLTITEDDMKRNKMYVENLKRKEFEKSHTDMDEYLRNLNMTILINNTDDSSIQRVTQLLSKTNQYNLTTIRYSQNQIQGFINSAKHKVLNLSVEDRFGDNGITGVAILEIDGEKLRIDSLLLSCRIIGRKVESAMISKIISYAKEMGATKIIGDIIFTPKNVPARDIYKDYGFGLVEETTEKTVWSLDLTSPAPFTTPNYLHVIDNTGPRK